MERSIYAQIIKVFLIFVLNIQIVSTLYSQEVINYKGININVEQVSFKGFDGINLKGLIFTPQNKSNLPAIIVNHGFGGTKDSFCSKAYTKGYEGSHMPVAEELAKAGFIVLAYDQRGTGESEGDLELTDRIKDVENAIAFIKKYPQVNTNMIGLFGHSLGSYIGAVAGAIYKDIKAVTLWSTPTSIDYLLKETLNSNNQNLASALYDGMIVSSNFVEPVIQNPSIMIDQRVSNVLGDLGLSFSLTADSKNINIGGAHTFGIGASDKGAYIIIGSLRSSVYNLMRTVIDSKELNPQLYIDKISPRPLLLIHGMDDPLIPFSSSELLYTLAGDPKKLILIENTDHMYRKPENKVDTVIELTVSWFKDNLK
jgi:dipeptidyl aminopeptidase/acylaminoacyl peptidase